MLLLTYKPEYSPPAGIPPDRTKVTALAQIVSGLRTNETVGSGLTLTETGSDSEAQLEAFVALRTYSPA